MSHPLKVCSQMLDELKDYFIEDPNPFAIDLSKSHGMWLATVDGVEIFDWCAIYASKLIGFNHPRMREPHYIEKLITAANNKLSNPYYLTEDSLTFYRLIHKLKPKCMRGEKVKVMTTNSGAEAVENMMKYLITLHRNRLLQENKTINCRRFVYFDKAFHGRTGFAINVTQVPHDPIITRDYGGIIANNIIVPFPDVDNDQSREENLKQVQRALEHIEFIFKVHGDEIVGIILEPIQGSGGQRVALPEFFVSLSELCHKYNVYMGIDEVQTAGGQTGEIFCIDLFNLPHSPQAVATAKKFANGVVYMNEQLKESGALDSTWCGSYVDMIRFMQEWKIVEDEKLIENVAQKSAYFEEKLLKLKKCFPQIISNVRGVGLYQGFSLANAKMKSRVFELSLNNENLFLFPAGERSIRFRPVLDVTIGDIDQLVEKLERVLRSL
ncbi:MAG: aminotransferase class III-fold pyridoxal phosphate-dependent enzyme [Oligoflexia bacterium]|nr:aminotransferase class III-fold pyridoxal phosphate-dependent enzyme [Oligoflexia bacterium]